MPAELEPPELARLVAFAERPRTGDWSLRAALCRYASPQPGRVSAVLDHVRRIEFALQPRLKRLAEDGPVLWALHETGGAASGPDAQLVGLLGTMAELDGLGDQLAEWAVARATDRPDDAVDATIASVGARLDELGIPHEERQRPPGARSRGRAHPSPPAVSWAEPPSAPCDAAR